MDEQFHNGVARELGGIHENLKNIYQQMKEVKEQMVIANGRTRKLEDENLAMKVKVGVISATISGAVALGVWAVNFFFK